MKSLYQLVCSLTSSEKDVVKKYLHCFSGQQSKSTFLTEQLFDYLLKQKDVPSEKNSCIAIYGTFRKKDALFEKLKQRLKNKLLEAICLDLNNHKNDFLDEIDYVSLRIKKKSSQARFLFYAKSALDITYSLLDELIADCKKYEFYAPLTEHLKFKLYRYGFKEKKIFKELCTEIERYEECDAAVYKANNYHYQLIYLSEHTAKNNPKKILDFLIDAISDLQNAFKKTRSVTVYYYLKYLEVNYFMARRDYIQARRICLDLIKLVRQEPAVKRRRRIGIAYDYFSRCEFYLGNYEQSAEYAKTAQGNFVFFSHNYSVALEQEFYALFFMKKYSAAIEIADKMIHCTTKEELGGFRYEKYNYLLSNAYFSAGRFIEALHLLKKQKELSKDKSGWEIGIRTLRIMTFIELGSMDEASKAIYRLKDFLTYLNKKDPASIRDKSILHLLLIAERKGFLFHLLNGTAFDHLSTLSSSDEATRWEPFTHELIPFHEWFAGKMKHKLPLQVKVGSAKTLPKAKEKTASH